MIIALDFDGTFTLDPSFWTAFIGVATVMGHEVICVTARPETEEWPDSDLDALPETVHVYKTRLRPKRAFMDEVGVPVDVWIDDAPEMIG